MRSTARSSGCPSSRRITASTVLDSGDRRIWYNYWQRIGAQAELEPAMHKLLTIDEAARDGPPSVILCHGTETAQIQGE